MAQPGSPPLQGRNNSPNKKKPKNTQGLTNVAQRDQKQSQYKTERRTRSTAFNEKYLAPADHLTVWTKGWQFPDKFELSFSTLEPFTELFGENDSLHDAIKIRNKTNVPNKNGHTHTVAFWKDLFAEGFEKKHTFYLTQEDKNKAKQVAIRLALTSPTIFEDFLWKNDNLSAREDTAAWSAAQQLLGTWRWNPDQIETNSITPTKTDHKNTPNPDQTTRNDDDKTNSNQTTRNEEGKSNFDQTARNKEGKTNSNNDTENTADKGKNTKKHWCSL